MAHDCTDQLESMMQMTQAALSVKNTAIDTLTSELNLLRTENDLLAQLASAKGGEQVPRLMRSLQQAELEAQHLTNRLQQEVEIREDLERELEDTAAAAQELWESMQAVYNEAAEADSRANSRSDTPVSGKEEWGTPPGAVSPAAGLTPSNSIPQQQQPSIAEAAAAALASNAVLGSAASPAPARSATAAPAALPVHKVLSKEAVAAMEAVKPPSPAMHGILTPLENKLQSLSNKLVGLVKWIDARESSTPCSTPRGSMATPPSTAVTPTGSADSNSRRSLDIISPIPLSSLSPEIKNSGTKCERNQIGRTASPDSVKGGKAAANSNSKLSSSVSKTAATTASAEQLKHVRQAEAPEGDSDDVRVRDSSLAGQ